MSIRIEGTVTRYPYRTARVAGVRFPRAMMKDLEEQLAAPVDAQSGNHTVYKIQQDGRTLYIMFSDQTATVGSSIIEGNW